MTQPFMKNGKPVFSGGQPSFGCGGGCSAAFCTDLGGGECLAYEEIGDSPITDIDGDGIIEPNNPTGGKQCVEWRQCFHYTDQSEPSKGAEIVSWLWEWEDGETSTDQNPTHCTTQTVPSRGDSPYTDYNDDGLRWTEDGNNETNDDPVPVLIPAVKLTVTDSAGCVSTTSRPLKREKCEEVLEEIPCEEILDRISSLTATVSGMREDCVANTVYLSDECNINICAPDPPWMPTPTGSRASAFSCADFNGVYELDTPSSPQQDNTKGGSLDLDTNTCFGGQSQVMTFSIHSMISVWPDSETEGKCSFHFLVHINRPDHFPWAGFGGFSLATWEGSVTLTNPEDIARTPVTLEAVDDGYWRECYQWPKNGTCDDPSAGDPVSVPNCTIEVSLI